MSDIQIDWLGAVAFIIPPLAFLFMQGPFSKKNNAFYEHHVFHSAWFPSGRMRLIFPIAWWLLFTMEGIAAYLIWHDGDTTTASHLTTFNVALVMYWVQLVLCFAWMNLFFNRDNPRWLSFVSILFIDAAAIGVLACVCILQLAYPIATFALLVLWLIYANILTILSTFHIPPYKERQDPYDVVPSSPQQQQAQQNDVIYSQNQIMQQQTTSVPLPPPQQQQQLTAQQQWMASRQAPINTSAPTPAEILRQLAASSGKSKPAIDLSQLRLK